MRTKRNKLFLFILLALLLVALPTSTVLANKQVWKAQINTANEVHQVVDSNAKGSGVFSHNPDGSLHFLLVVRGLSGAPTGAHLHAPAGSGENAAVVVTLCGSGPGTAVLSGACPFDNGEMLLEGNIYGYNLTGISGGDFFNALN